MGQGSGTLTCRCGDSVLVKGYDPRAFLAVDFQCAACGHVTTTPGLAALDLPPTSIIPLERIGETSAHGTTIPAGAVLAGREELDRLTALYQPRPQPTDEMTVTAAFLDAIEAEYDRLTGGLLAAHTDALAASGAEPAAGLSDYPLLWSVRTHRRGLGETGWSCAGTNETAVASVHLGAFRYFLDSWSHHPLFLMMTAAAADTRFSLHGLVPYAAAKSIADAGNRIGFLMPVDGSTRVRDFYIALGPNERLTCVTDPFGRYAWPYSQHPPPDALRAAVQERLEASVSRINLKRPGMVILSPGATDSALDQPMVDAVLALMQSHGRRYRGLSAMGIAMAKLKATAQPDTVRFGYNFYPMANPRYMGAGSVRVGAREG